MRFFEYESREIVKRAGIPVTDFGFTTDAAQARAAAEEIGEPTVIKSQVLTGGRMKAGGVKFADTPDEAAEHAAAILELEINGQMPVGVLVDPKADVAHEYYAGVVWDGTAKRPRAQRQGDRLGRPPRRDPGQGPRLRRQPRPRHRRGRWLPHAHRRGAQPGRPAR